MKRIIQKRICRCLSDEMKLTIKLSLLLVVCLPFMFANCVIAQETNKPSSYDDRRFIFGEDDKLKQAISLLSQQVRSEPTNITAIYNLALAYRVKGDFDKSLALFDDYIRLNQTNDVAFNFRAQIYAVTGKYDEAIKDFNEGLRLNPDNANAIAARGFAYSQKGEYNKAAQDFTKAVQLDPTSDFACNNLAWLRATCPIPSMRDGKEAVLLATKACNLTHWARWTRIDTLAAAYAEAGDFSKAIDYDRMALKMNGITKSDIEELQNHISLYEKQQPYRNKENH